MLGLKDPLGDGGGLARGRQVHPSEKPPELDEDATDGVQDRARLHEGCLNPVTPPVLADLPGLRRDRLVLPPQEAVSLTAQQLPRPPHQLAQGKHAPPVESLFAAVALGGPVGAKNRLQRRPGPLHGRRPGPAPPACHEGVEVDLV